MCIIEQPGCNCTTIRNTVKSGLSNEPYICTYTIVAIGCKLEIQDIEWMCMEHTLIIIYSHISHVKEANYCNNILEFYHSWYSVILQYWYTDCIHLNIFPTQLLTPLIRIYIYFRDEKIIEQGPIDSYTLVGRNLSCFEMYFCLSDYPPTILRTKAIVLIFFSWFVYNISYLRKLEWKTWPWPFIQIYICNSTPKVCIVLI